VHRLFSSFILGYHGCRKSVGEKLLAGESFTPSENDYDWLGSGIYFWESNPVRAFNWATELRRRKPWPSDEEPFVVGAVIDMGYCLDLLTDQGLRVVKAAYMGLAQDMERAHVQLPFNSGGDDLLLRRLDCAVINYLHTAQKRSKPESPIQTIRGVFIEGDPLYKTSGFREKTHIQICVRDARMIKGVFRVSQDQTSARDF
jgi:hypothetical protein